MHVLNWVKVYFRRFTTPRNGRTILFQGNIMKLFDGITVQVVEANYLKLYQSATL